MDLIGLKWISSFPNNTRSGMPRASGVLLLNDYETGASHCLPRSRWNQRKSYCCFGCRGDRGTHGADVVEVRGVQVGKGVIARTIADYLFAGHDVGEVRVHDVDRYSADRLAAYARTALGAAVDVCTLERALASDCVVFTTTASRPYVPVDAPVFPGQVLLNVSLRDLPPELLLRCNNIVDDVGAA